MAEPFATKSARAAYFAENRINFSPMYRLDYWSSVESMPVDVMHNIFQGLVKRAWLQQLVQGGFLTKPRMTAAQSVIYDAKLPNEGCSRPDARLGDPSGGSSTAAQWCTLARVLLPLSSSRLSTMCSRRSRTPGVNFPTRSRS